MNSLFRAATLLTAACALYAQQPNTVTANVTVNQPVSAGTATFRIQFLDASRTSTVEAAVGALGATGISASSLTGVSVYINQGILVTQYDFIHKVPAGEFAGVRDRLISIQQSVPSSQAVGWSTAYAASDDDTLKALQDTMPALLAKARQQAEVLASAIGVTLGAAQSVAAPVTTSDGLSLAISLKVTYGVQQPAAAAASSGLKR